MRILVIDPSGSFHEGKGTTGWAWFNVDEHYPKGKVVAVGQLKAEICGSAYEHQKAHIDLIKSLQPDYVVIEDYLLYASKASTQIHSRMETPKLIGIMEYYLDTHNIPHSLQRAVDVLKRWADRLLVKKGYVTTNDSKTRYYAASVLTSVHMRDAIRHGVHFIHFKLPKIKEELDL